MTFLYCVQYRLYSTQATATTWAVGYFILAGFFLLLTAYSLVPVIRYWPEFRGLSALNRTTRAMITVAIVLKFLGNLIAVSLGRTQYTDYDPSPVTVGKLGFIGLMALELPAYVVSTVYTLVLLFWLLTCLELLPQRYETRFRTMKIVLIVYNFLLYALFLTSAMLMVAQSGAHIQVYSITAIMRDLVLSTIFVIFYFSLKLGLREIETSMAIEKQLIKSTLALAALVLLRGVLPFVQGIMLMTDEHAQKQECRIGFLIWWGLSELLIEGGPLWYLVRVNNGFLVERHQEESDRRRSRIEDSFLSGM
jgi:hypothetical protein